MSDDDVYDDVMRRVRARSPQCLMACECETAVGVVSAMYMVMALPTTAPEVRDRLQHLVREISATVREAAPQLADVIDRTMADETTAHHPIGEVPSPPVGEATASPALQAEYDRFRTYCSAGVFELDWQTILSICHCVTIAERDPEITDMTRALARQYRESVLTALRSQCPPLARLIEDLQQVVFAP